MKFPTLIFRLENFIFQVWHKSISEKEFKNKVRALIKEYEEDSK